MSSRLPGVFVCIAGLILLSGCACRKEPEVSSAMPSLNSVKLEGEPPAAPREFRAAWVATVGNIDWPSIPGLSTADQQREILTILDKAAELHLNALILQVRTSCDAFYPSPYEPWSAFLSGTQGQAPEPFYDPLKFWIDESHKRGLELHAWFNPFRARAADAKYAECAAHIGQTRPDLVKKYGGFLWLDPGEEEASDLTFKMFMDVLSRYEIDGIHIDDYFYPYPILEADKKTEVPFPDEPSWVKYQAAGGTLARAEWRRQNINQLIEKTYAAIKARKPEVKFGISPFGIMRPGQPKVAVGFDQYEKLYADAQLWLNRGWCDYISPQLYWKIDAPGQPYAALLEYWVQENKLGRHVWPGNFTSRLDPQSKNVWESGEIANQIGVTRRTPGAGGNIHFSMKALMMDYKGIVGNLKEGPYSGAALVPASPWLGQSRLRVPELSVRAADANGNIYASWKLLDESEAHSKAWLWAVYIKYGHSWKFSVLPAATLSLEIKAASEAGPVKAIAISAVGRVGEESGRAVINLP